MVGLLGFLFCQCGSRGAERPRVPAEGCFAPALWGCRSLQALGKRGKRKELVCQPWGCCTLTSCAGGPCGLLEQLRPSEQNCGVRGLCREEVRWAMETVGWNHVSPGTRQGSRAGALKDLVKITILRPPSPPCRRRSTGGGRGVCTPRHSGDSGCGSCLETARRKGSSPRSIPVKGEHLHC